MVINRIAILFILSILYGCKSTEKQILDFSGIVFFVFFIMVIAQLYSHKIVSSSPFKKFDACMSPVRKIIPFLAYFLGVVLFFVGLISDDLKQINMFLGIITVLFGWFMQQYNKSVNDDKIRSRYAKLMMLCVTFGFSFFFLMTAAKDVLNF